MKTTWIFLTACVNSSAQAETCNQDWTPHLPYFGGSNVSFNGVNFYNRWYANAGSHPLENGDGWVAVSVCERDSQSDPDDAANALQLSHPTKSKRSSSSCTYGDWKCAGQALQQCAYGTGNVLLWVTIETCASGTHCSGDSAQGYGCLSGAPTSSSSAPTSSVKTSSGTHTTTSIPAPATSSKSSQGFKTTTSTTATKSSTASSSSSHSPTPGPTPTSDAKPCSTFGGYQCSGPTLQQCAYGADNLLHWTTIQTCGTDTLCSAFGYIGCVTGSSFSSAVSSFPTSTEASNKITSSTPGTSFAASASPLPTAGTSGSNKYKIVSYWGAHPGAGEKNLKEYCDTKTYNIIHLSFIDKILPKASLSADITQRPNGYGLPQIAADILYCQSIGVKIGVSVGGYVGSVGLATGGAAVAKDLWDNFLGGSTPLAKRTLPGVVLDGVDLDIETATGNNAGYAQLTSQLRSLIVASGQNYYISAAPQCVIPDANMDYTLKNGWFDFVTVQFYSSGCGIGFTGQGNGPNYDNNASVWNNGQGSWLSQTALWPNKNVKLIVGFPASSSAGNFGGDADPWLYVKQYVSTWAAENPNVFGGLMWWDTFWMGRTAAGPSQYVTLLNNLSTPPSAPSTPNSGSNTPFPIPSPIPAPANPSIPSPKKAVYIDAWANGAAGFNVPGYTTNDYNIILLSFWTWGAGAVDMVQSWTQLDAATREKYVAAFHEAGKLVMVSAFGSTEFPTGQDPVAVATKLAKFVTDYRLDGADVDWEDSAAFQNGTGEAWLITFTITLRKLLPSPKYAISHAPQAPYFVNDKKIYPNGAYLTVDKKAGSAIDWYNVQFYNQGDNRYDTCTTLLNTSGGPFPGTSIFEINALGVDLNKLVIGKPIATAGVSNTGLMDVGALAACLVQAKGKGWRAGVMGWQLSLDPEGAWIHTLSASL